jgi:hypothetical protein
LAIPFISIGFLNILSNSILATVTMPNIRHLRDGVALTGNALSVTSVENILATLVGLDGTNGTSIYGKGKTVNLSGGTSAGLAALSAAAIANKDALIARGCTVTLNP